MTSTFNSDSAFSFAHVIGLFKRATDPGDAGQTQRHVTVRESVPHVSLI